MGNAKKPRRLPGLCQLRVYLAGPMLGLPGHNLQEFADTTEWLRAKGLTVVSPAEINHPYHRDGEPMRPARECLTRDIRALVDCFAIALMPGWSDSTGARLEAAIALVLGLSFYRVDRRRDLFEPMDPPHVVQVTAYGYMAREIHSWAEEMEPRFDEPT